MDEAAHLLDRLDRIARLDRDKAPAQVLLAEVRALLTEAEAWARTEARDDERAQTAVRALNTSLERATRAAEGVKRTLVA